MGAPENPSGIARGHVVTAISFSDRRHADGLRDFVVSVEIGGKWYEVIRDLDAGGIHGHIMELGNHALAELTPDEDMNSADPGPVPKAVESDSLEHGDFDWERNTFDPSD